MSLDRIRAGTDSKQGKETLTHLVFQSSSDLAQLLRAALCFSSSLFFSSLAKSEGTTQKVKGQNQTMNKSLGCIFK